MCFTLLLFCSPFCRSLQPWPAALLMQHNSLVRKVLSIKVCKLPFDFEVLQISLLSFFCHASLNFEKVFKNFEVTHCLYCRPLKGPFSLPAPCLFESLELTLAIIYQFTLQACLAVYIDAFLCVLSKE